MSRKIEEIREIARLTNQDLEYLQNSRLPLVLFGVAEMAHAVKSILDMNGIEITYVVVDGQFYRPQQYFYEIPVTLFEDVLREKEFNMVLAFSPVKHLEKFEELRKIRQVKRWIFFDTFPPFDFDFDFVNTHYTAFEKLFFQLQDDLSRNVFLEFIKAKNLLNSKELMQFNVPNEEQYFPDFLPLSSNEVFVDCGAFTGDTIEVFLNKTKGKYNKIFAFEPDSINADKCREMLKNYGGGGGGGGVI
jgi:hypothetical protein